MVTTAIMKKWNDEVKDSELYVEDQSTGKKILLIEAWYLLFSMTSITPLIQSVKVEDGWMIVEALLYNKDHEIISRGYATCSRDEDFSWLANSNVTKHILLSTAQTRAINKAALIYYRLDIAKYGYSAIEADLLSSNESAEDNKDDKKQDKKQNKKQDKKKGMDADKFVHDTFKLCNDAIPDVFESEEEFRGYLRMRFESLNLKYDPMKAATQMKAILTQYKKDYEEVKEEF